ncbi:MAG: hypothetical protein Q7V01_16145 [Vicinamibacterales bacterium]|nr:hypothetical protein [Vicinamibacterales bacterium]
MPKTATRKLSRTHKPQDMSLEAWQRELRRQFGREQPFTLKNVGGEPVFSEYQVTNRDTAGSYRVAIRGAAPDANYCSHDGRARSSTRSREASSTRRSESS